MAEAKYRFHVVSLPWTRTNLDNTTCAYTQKCVRFAEMMMERGHEVFLYSGIDNTAPCTEHIVAITEEEQADILNTTDAPWDPNHPAWIAMNIRAGIEIAKRAKPKDFLLLITGAQQRIAQANPGLTTVEFGIGYSGTFAKHKVYESYAWMHTCLGAQEGTNWDINAQGHWYDTVIPNYFNIDDFHTAEPDEKDPYFLFIGRGISRKGAWLAADVAKHLDVPLILAGQDLGGFPDYGTRVGAVGPKERADLYAGAIATFVPTTYCGPFEGVAVESLLSGTPVICTDAGAFTENILEFDGWRCSTMAEFTDAARAAITQSQSDVAMTNAHWGRTARRARAVKRFGYDAVAPMYERFFRNLMELWSEGWTALEHPEL